MYVESNTEMRSRNRFREVKQQFVLCVVELHVTVNCTRIVSVAQQCCVAQ
jgi:hypothetical protein